MCNSLQVFLKINLLSVCELIDYHLCVIDYHNIVEANMAFFKQDNQLPQTHNRLYQIAIRFCDPNNRLPVSCNWLPRFENA